MANSEPKPARSAKPAVETLHKAADAAAETAATAANTTRDMAAAAFDYPNLQVPEMVRSLTEQGLSRTREAYGRMKEATEEATGVMEQSFETSRESIRDVQLKTLDIAKANADATFDLVRRLMTVSSVSDAIQMQATFARERFDALVDYSRDVQSSLTKAGTEAAKPARVMLDRAVNQTKAA